MKKAHFPHPWVEQREEDRDTGVCPRSHQSTARGSGVRLFKLGPQSPVRLLSSRKSIPMQTTRSVWPDGLDSLLSTVKSLERNRRAPAHPFRGETRRGKPPGALRGDKALALRSARAQMCSSGPTAPSMLLSSCSMREVAGHSALLGVLSIPEHLPAEPLI